LKTPNHGDFFDFWYENILSIDKKRLHPKFGIWNLKTPNAEPRAPFSTFSTEIIPSLKKGSEETFNREVWKKFGLLELWNAQGNAAHQNNLRFPF
jgi:hypothetical protein